MNRRRFPFTGKASRPGQAVSQFRKAFNFSPSCRTPIRHPASLHRKSHWIPDRVRDDGIANQVILAITTQPVWARMRCSHRVGNAGTRPVPQSAYAKGWFTAPTGKIKNGLYGRNGFVKNRQLMKTVCFNHVRIFDPDDALSSYDDLRLYGYHHPCFQAQFLSFGKKGKLI